MSLEGKVFVVTGAASGIGFATAEGLAREKALVVCVGRSEERQADVVARVNELGGKAEAVAGDLSLMADVRRVANEISTRHARIDALINNAGIWQAKREATSEGFEKTWAVNVLAPHLLSQMLLEPLRAARGRVVNLSSEEHTNGRIWWEDTQFEQGFSARHAYRQSKLAITMLTFALAARERDITANCLHPGIAGTRLFRNFPAFIRFWINLLMRKPAAAAGPVIRLATDPALADVSGRFFNRYKEHRAHGIALHPHLCTRLFELVQNQLGEA